MQILHGLWVHFLHLYPCEFCLGRQESACTGISPQYTVKIVTVYFSLSSTALLLKNHTGNHMKLIDL